MARPIPCEAPVTTATRRSRCSAVTGRTIGLDQLLDQRQKTWPFRARAVGRGRPRAPPHRAYRLSRRDDGVTHERGSRSAQRGPAVVSRPSATPRERAGFLPIIAQLRSYDRAWLRGDLLAGVVVAALTGALAVVAGVLGGPAEALGTVTGSALMVTNLAGLRWAVGRLIRGLEGTLPEGRRAAWVGASGIRLGLVGLAVGIAAGQGWVGVRGLLAALLILPVAVVVAGLRVTRAA